MKSNSNVLNNSTDVVTIHKEQLSDCTERRN